MGESQQHLNRHHHGHRQLLHSPRLPVQPKTGGMKESGEIVEVQGGHILRSTGRKDRHSKVFTAKGPRDRRVRLSAHTAIQFYDVQDRLGYDRPSKAVDWLIKNAKAAIDELAGLPPKKASSDSQTPSIAEQSERPLQNSEDLSSSSFGFASGSILPHSLDSDAIADTIKSFFPISVAAGGSTSTATDFQSYSAEQGENLRLSLHSFQEPILLSGHSSAQHRSALFSHYDAGPSSWPEQNLRMIPWNVAPDAAPLHSLLGQSSHIAQRGPLQSSWPSNVRAWADSFAAVDPQPYEAGMNLAAPPVGSTLGGFPGFRIPPRIQGEDHDAMPSKRSSATASHQ